MKLFCGNSSGKDAVNCFCIKNSMIYVSKGSNYVSLAASFSWMVNTKYLKIQKQRFTNVLQNRCSWKFCNFTEKIPCIGVSFKNFNNTDGFLWNLPFFKISDSNNLFRRFFIPDAQQISDRLQLSKWQTNLKMHSLTKSLFR